MRAFLVCLLAIAVITAEAQKRRRRTTTTAEPAVCESKSGPTFKLGSFNIQVFGTAKQQNKPVMQIITKILGRYDLFVMLEARDSSGTAVPALANELNEAYPDNPFEYVESARLGKSNSKEQYVLMYRSGINVIAEYQFEDPQGIFERPPYMAVVKLPSGFKFGIIMIHTKPENAVEEIDALRDVYVDWAKPLVKDVVIAGDFNADCSYVPKKAWSGIRLRTESEFTWLIGDDDDTTTAPTTTCAYDRFVLAGPKMKSKVDACTASEFRFDDYFNLSRDEASAVSDHYPIEIAVLAAK